MIPTFQSGSLRHRGMSPKLAGFLAAASVLMTGHAWGAESKAVFSGELERVTTGSISILLEDGRIIEARNTPAHGNLSARTLAEDYKIGDQVEITCAAIAGVYDSVVGRRLFLELKKLRFLRAPSPQERAMALTSRAWRQSPNVLQGPPAGDAPGAPPNKIEIVTTAGSPPEWPARLEQVRSRILKFVAEMPNFVADEVAKRYVSTGNPPDWRLVDTIQSEITFKGNAVTREHLSVNGKPWNEGYRALPGFKWTDAFGSQLKFLFDENCPTAFEPEGPVIEEGKTLTAVRYSSPPDGCEFYWQNYQQFYPDRAGRILLDERGENLVRLETNSGVFPREFPIASTRKRVSWDYVKIGDATHLLPVSAEIQVVLANGEMRLARHEYTNHRHFEAASNITFH